MSEPPDSVQSNGDDGEQIGCTLSPAGRDERMEWVESELSTHLTEVEEHSDGYTLRFSRSREAYDAVAELAWREADCCGWATFDVTVSGDDGPITLRERSPHDEGTKLFGDALAAIRGSD